MPSSAWLSKVTIDAAAPDLTFDLAIDASGAGAPSRIMAGLDLPGDAVARTVRRDHPRLGLGLTLEHRRDRWDAPAGPPTSAAVDGLRRDRAR